MPLTDPRMWYGLHQDPSTKATNVMAKKKATKRAMSAEHKQALAKGRAEGKARPCVTTSPLSRRRRSPAVE